MRNFKMIFFLCFFFLQNEKATSSIQKTIKSPNKEITVSIELSNQINFSILFQGQKILQKGTIALELQNEILGNNPK